MANLDYSWAMDEQTLKEIREYDERLAKQEVEQESTQEEILEDFFFVDRPRINPKNRIGKRIRKFVKDEEWWN